MTGYKLQVGWQQFPVISIISGLENTYQDLVSIVCQFIEQMQDLPYTELAPRKQNQLPIYNGKALCNYFPLQLTREFESLYVFGVEISPHIPMEKIGLRTRILAMLQNQISRIVAKPVISGLNVYSHSQPKVNEKMFESGEYRILMKLQRVIRVNENPDLLISVLNCFIRNIMVKKGYNLLCNSRKYYDMKKRVQHFAVHKYSGFHIDFVKSEQLFYLRIDASRKIVCSQTAQDAIEYYFKLCKRDKDQKRRFVKQKMIGRTVMANYGKNRFYKIKDIAFQPLEYERIEESKPLTEYYEEKYGVEVKNLTQNLLVISNKKLQKQGKKCFLIPQLCFMVGFPDDIEQSKQKQILNQMKIQPEETRTQSNQLFEIVNEDTEEWKNLQRLGIEFDSKQMLKMDYKKFPTPVLELGKRSTVQRGLETFFNIAGRPIYKPNKDIRCSILFFNRVDTTYLISILQKNSKDVGMKVTITKTDLGELNNNKALTQIQNGVLEAIKQHKANILLIILPNQFKSYYRKIKKFCLVDHKVLTQIVCQSQVISTKNNLSVFGKILLQLYVKCGSILWVPKQVLKSDRSIMLVAFDANKAGAETVISTCCTVDQTYYVAFSKYGFCADNNEDSTELLEVMTKNTIMCLQYYSKRNGKLPDQLIFMSKAGSISVKEAIFKSKFVFGLKKELTQFYEDKELCMTYILLQTKDSTKFFIYDNPHGKARNTQIGTIVDQKIVKNSEFLVVTQSTSEVASIPVRFKLVEEQTKIDRTLLQQLLFNQCFGYANFTGLIQIPAILQYARKCAKFVSQAPFQEKLQEWIEQTPYYL